MGEETKNMENNTYKTTLKVIGTIDTNVLQRFMEETDEIIEVYKQYLDETAYIKEEYVQPFDRIKIEISSYGGCTDSGSAMLDRIMEMQEMGLHVDTHCNGMAYSMAFILFIVGERRSGGKFSKYMNHSSSASTYGMIDKMKTDIDFYGECDRQFDNLILKQTNMPKERLEMARLKNDWIFYDEAIELGIVNVYEGKEETKEEYVEKLSKAFDLSIKTFSKVANSEEGDSIFILYDMLADVIEMLEEKEEEVKEKAEKKVKATKEKTDDEELLEKAKEILDSIELCKKEGNKCEKCEFKKECEEDEKEALEILGLEDEEDDEE